MSTDHQAQYISNTRFSPTELSVLDAELATTTVLTFWNSQMKAQNCPDAKLTQWLLTHARTHGFQPYTTYDITYQRY